MDDAVRVNVEGDLDLRHTTGSRRDTGELEGAQTLVVLSDLALTLEYLDENRGLVVIGGGEDLGTLGRDGRVALDELSHEPTFGLNTQGQRSHVNQQDILAIALQHAGLQARAD